jgi:hypothetical protein
MADAVIKTAFGSVSIAFTNREELTAKLAELQEQLPLIEEFARRVTPPQPRAAKPSLEEWCRFDSTGRLELLKVPDKQFDAVCLVLFAYNPDLVSASEIETLVGLDEVARRVLAQASYKDTFRKVDDKYGLTFAGLKTASQKFGASLEAADTEDPSAK